MVVERSKAGTTECIGSRPHILKVTCDRIQPGRECTAKGENTPLPSDESEPPLSNITKSPVTSVETIVEQVPKPCGNTQISKQNNTSFVLPELEKQSTNAIAQLTPQALWLTRDKGNAMVKQIT